MGVSYINECCSRTSVHYAAEARRQELQSDEIIIVAVLTSLEDAM